MARLETVVLPVAGRGTRLLPMTKAVPKELLPVYDKPVLQFAIEEALAAGATRLVLITHPTKASIETHLQPADDLVALLEGSGKSALAQCLQDTCPPDEVEVIFVQQPEPLGLGHAVSLAAPHVTGDAFGVILPDDVILGVPCMAEMAARYVGGHLIAAMDVAQADVSKYGIFAPAGDAQIGPMIRAAGMVEKPAPSDAPSRLAAVGRYILDTTIFRELASGKPGAGGEIQLTDAIAAGLDRTPLGAFRFSGERHDCGNQDGLLQAAIARQAMISTGKQSIAAE